MEWLGDSDGKPNRQWLKQDSPDSAADGLVEHKAECLACSDWAKQQVVLQSKLDNIESHEVSTHIGNVKEWETALANEQQLSKFVQQEVLASWPAIEVQLTSLLHLLTLMNPPCATGARRCRAVPK